MAKKILILCGLLLSMLLCVPGVFASETGTAIVSGNPALTMGITADAGSATFGEMVPGVNVNTSVDTVNVHVVSNAPWAVDVSDLHNGAGEAGTAGYMAEWNGAAWVAGGKVLSTPLEIGATPLTTFPLTGSVPLFSGIAGTFDNYPCFKQVIGAETRVITGHSYRLVTTFTATAV
jgi:hypothetical protein